VAQSGKQLAEIFRKATQAHQEGRYADAEKGYRKIARRAPDHFDVLHLLGQCLIQSQSFSQAVPWLEKAVRVNPACADAWSDLGLACRKSGENRAARSAFLKVLALEPDYLKAHLSLVELKCPGPHYKAVLAGLHAWLKPATYLEIGVETGESMAQAGPQTRCIGIDPEPKIRYALPPNCDIYAQTSDSFFEQFDVRELFSQQPVDFAFIDGLHMFEAALRDFINVERVARRDSVVAIHDCIPLDAATSSRQRRTSFWSGDIWKLVLVLRKYRPELPLVSVATKPTGLGLVTGLDSGNRVLEDNYARIVEEFESLSYDDIVASEAEALNIVANNLHAVTDWLQAHRLQQAC
jgi:tetratricopeptide (TPR) repeat protein